MKFKKNNSILVVDDTDSWRELIITVLEEEGYKVYGASNFIDAKRLLGQHEFDLAILDMRLIDESVENVQGLAVLKEAKKIQPKIKAIMYTGYPDEEQKNKAINYYMADDFIEKVPDGIPLDIDLFCQKVFNLINPK